ncbi:MAG: hypothetical protein IJC29_01260 [Clostridia bacterium]|nr:hypothetical protein [Clostridia bacterium]
MFEMLHLSCWFFDDCSRDTGVCSHDDCSRDGEGRCSGDDSSCRRDNCSWDDSGECFCDSRNRGDDGD